VPHDTLSGCFVGIDLGTSGCRAIAIDAAGKVLGESRAPLPATRHLADSGREQDPGAWWAAVLATLDGLHTQGTGPVAAISVDGTSGSILLCDAEGRPCGPALMYDDTRAVGEARRVATIAPADSPARGAGSTLARLLWLLGRSPAAAAHAMHQADWVAGRLAGHYGESDENNCLKLGYDPVSGCWPDWLAGLALPPGILPRVRRVGSVLGALDPALAGRGGLHRGTRVVAGTTDSNAAALAAGIERPGDAVTSLGTTLVLKVLARRPVSSGRYGVYSHRIGANWLVGGASNSGGGVLRQHFSDNELAELSAGIDPDRPLGLGYYPLPGAGERFPRNDPHMLPRMTPRPADRAAFLQALLEGMADIEAEGYARLAELGAPLPQRVFSAGGGAANPAWQRIRARRLGVPLLPARHPEAAYGTALLARAAVTPDAGSAADPA
jgi:sugar (pentulose or hexulose) kinase